MSSNFYTLASGLLTRQREMDTIGNNLTNLKTPGYRADRVEISAFEKELLTRIEANGTQSFSSGAVSAIIDKIYSDMTSGDISQTSRELDMAINGQGFFNILDGGNEVCLTKNGAFDMDNQGYLCLSGVGRVLGQNGPIYIGQSGIQVNQNGEVYSADGTYIDKLLITQPAENATLLKMGNGTFKLPNGANAPATVNFEVKQGYLEQSNVDLNQELTKLIESQRAFQACSSAMQIVDGINQRAAKEIGSV